MAVSVEITNGQVVETKQFLSGEEIKSGEGYRLHTLPDINGNNVILFEPDPPRPSRISTSREIKFTNTE